MNIVQRRYLFFAISLIIIIPGVVGLIIWGLPMGIDFTGGSLLEIRFPSSADRPQPADVIAIYEEYGFPDSLVQTSGEDGLIIRSKNMDDATKDQIITEIENQSGSTVTILRFESVGPSVGQEVASRAAGAV
ncbi:MAG: protein translocase subunit SecF, partial [Gammaproteobacteria bacterium]|nr:protein translocase subunit SecF [candidate division Zixibacteria bacterium]NIR95444.1 protein translocase subunit SecF [Gammaproteobacteria bacterium]NIS45292.1 protein translocase subunit SecF [candidate division Zixibacteria bacterium]NIU13427.1 protein translocase subunit SecF [candidate division Zixibacteria bacterium]NIV05442.1 protein translocase subunit SecF [candidate division Zixibacteria bacterium]